MGDEIFLPLVETFPVGFIFAQIYLRRRPERGFRFLVHFPHIFVLYRKYNESSIVFPQQRFLLLAERHSRRVMIKEERVGALYVKWVSQNVHKVEKSHFMFKRWHYRKIKDRKFIFCLIFTAFSRTIVRPRLESLITSLS